MSTPEEAGEQAEEEEVDITTTTVHLLSNSPEEAAAEVGSKMLDSNTAVTPVATVHDSLHSAERTGNQTQWTNPRI